ncbi:MAG: lysophospholipid acyltransferase family protein [Akkermansiaceae bacterium]
MSRLSDIRGTRKQWAYGWLASFAMRLVGMTLRYRLDDPSGQRAKAETGEPMIWIFWHNALFAAPLTKTRFSGRAPASALASASKDGAVIEAMITSFGVKTIRGSSSRRGVAALIALKKALKAGEHLFITPDGPRGPRYELQPGVVKLAQSSSAPVIAVRFSYSSCWRTNTWDRFRIPKPFSKITIHVEEPIYVPSKLDENDFETYRKKVEGVLRRGIDDLVEPK